jgi:exonuclease III
LAGNAASLSVKSLNINDLNSPIKTCRLTDWVKTQDPTTFCLQEKDPTGKENHKLKGKDGK